MEISTFVAALQNASSIKAFLLDEQLVSILNAIGDTHLEAATRDLKAAKTASNPDIFIQGARTNLRTSQVAYERLCNKRGDLSSHFQLMSTTMLNNKLVFTILLQILCAVHLREENEAEALLSDLKKPIENLHLLFHGPDFEEDFGGFLKTMAYAAIRSPLAHVGLLNPAEWKNFMDNYDFEFEVERWPRDKYEELRKEVRKQF